MAKRTVQMKKGNVPNLWDRVLWGVHYVGTDGYTIERPILIGESYQLPQPEGYPGDPPRALLFYSRALAREWCKSSNARKVIQGRFVPVRVRETVRAI